jgi:hypothetical protein
VLYRWGKRRPSAAMAVGLAVYGLLQILAAVVSPATLFQGVLIKILVIAALLGGIGAELYLRKYEKALSRRTGAP